MAIEFEKHEKRWLKNVFFVLSEQPAPSSIGLGDVTDFNNTVQGKLRIVNNSPDNV